MMKSASILEFRRRTKVILQSVMNGQSILLTYRGSPVAKLEPVGTLPQVDGGDPFYKLADLASSNGDSLTNNEIDNMIYGQ